MPKADISVDIVTQIIVTIGPDEKKVVKEKIIQELKSMCNGLPEGQRPGMHVEKAGEYTRILLNISGLPDCDPESMKDKVRGIVNKVLVEDLPKPSGDGQKSLSSLTLPTDHI